MKLIKDGKKLALESDLHAGTLLVDLLHGSKVRALRNVTFGLPCQIKKQIVGVVEQGFDCRQQILQTLRADGLK